MPVVEYTCPFCGHKFELIFLSVKLSEEAKPVCFKCQREARRIISQTAPPIFIGEGFSKPTVREPEYFKDVSDHTVIDH